eukprot:2077762-Prymnesium_polylepis.1
MARASPIWHQVFGVLCAELSASEAVAGPLLDATAVRLLPQLGVELDEIGDADPADVSLSLGEPQARGRRPTPSPSPLAKARDRRPSHPDCAARRARLPAPVPIAVPRFPQPP